MNRDWQALSMGSQSRTQLKRLRNIPLRLRTVFDLNARYLKFLLQHSALPSHNPAICPYPPHLETHLHFILIKDT